MRQRYILLFWVPLFASWLLMTLEGPIISAVINRLPDEVVMLAAMGIVTSLSVTIESPIINLLATSTALSRDRDSYLLIRNFTLHWMIVLSGLTILLAFTPLFDFVVLELMNVPFVVAIWVQTGLKIMTFWSAAIAWRRFLQGIMIRFNRTRLVAWGTLVRLVSTTGSIMVMAIATRWPGVVIGSIALMAGVIAEAIYATVAVQPVLKNNLELTLSGSIERKLTYSELFWFHLPLAGTSLLTLLVQPLVAFSLSRASNPTLSLATWPVIFQIMLVSRAGAFALPEVIIALFKGESTFRSLRRFTNTLLLASTLFMVIFLFTPLLDFYLFTVQDLTIPVATMARLGLIFFIPLPALATLISWIRGLLIHQKATATVNIGMFINLSTTALVLLIGIMVDQSGINNAVMALCIAAGVEFLFLWRRVGVILPFHFSLLELRKSAVIR